MKKTNIYTRFKKQTPDYWGFMAFRNARISLFFLIISLIISPACDDFLTLDEPATFTDDTYFTNEKTANELIIGCYAIHKTGWPFTFLFSIGFIADVRTSDAIRGLPETHQRNPMLVELYWHKQTPTNGAVYDWWNYFYDGVGRSNVAIKKIKDIPVTGNPETGFSSMETKKRMIAEAKCLRAHYYAYLTKLWGDVPIIREPLSLDDYKIKRSSQEEVFDFIFEDCAYASANLPRKDGMEAGRCTKGMAMFLWVQNLVYEAGLDNSHENWDLAYQIADSLVNGDLEGEYVLLDKYGEIWMEGNDFNNEVIYEVVSVDNANFRHDYLTYIYPRDVQDSAGNKLGGWGFGSIAPTQDLVDAFETHGEPGDPDYWEDPRLQYSIWREGDIVPIGTTQGTGKGINDSLEVYLKETPSGYFMKKYWLNKEPSSWENQPINIKIWRFSDLILYHAEAAYYLDKGNIARESLEKVRARARQGKNNVLPEVTASGKELLEAIWHERRVELCLEQQRWFDLQRTGRIKEDIEKQSPPFQPEVNFVYKPGLELLPIPQAEIDLNPNLTQNPGYN